MSTLSVVNKFFPKVTSVIDATHNQAIEVTLKDASSKAVKDHKGCAMAVACKRKFHLDGVIISRSVAYLVKGKQARRFKLPQSVSREVVSFDRGAGFAPGIYALAKVPMLNRQGARAKRDDPKRSHKSQNPNKIKRFRHLTINVRSVLGGVQPQGETNK